MDPAVTLLVLAFAAQDVLRPEPPKVERSGPQWRVTLAVAADLPDETVISVDVRPVVLHYAEIREALEWQERESGQPARRALVERGKASLRITVPALQAVTVTWSVDPKAQSRGAKVEKDVAPVRVTWTLGPLPERLKAFRSGSEEPARLLARLLELLQQLEEVEKTPDRVGGWTAAIAKFRERCAQETCFTASVGFLDSVAGDAATYASWIRNRAKAEKERGGAGLNDAENVQNDAPSGTEPPVGGTSGPTGNGRRDNRDIRSDSAPNLRKRLAVFAKIARAELFLILDRETLELVESGKPVEPAPLSELEKAVDLVESRFKEEKDVAKHLREAIAALRSGDPAALGASRDALKAHAASLSGTK